MREKEVVLIQYREDWNGEQDFQFKFESSVSATCVEGRLRRYMAVIPADHNTVITCKLLFPINDTTLSSPGHQTNIEIIIALIEHLYPNTFIFRSTFIPLFYKNASSVPYPEKTNVISVPLPPKETQYVRVIHPELTSVRIKDTNDNMEVLYDRDKDSIVFTDIIC